MWIAVLIVFAVILSSCATSDVVMSNLTEKGEGENKYFFASNENGTVMYDKGLCVIKTKEKKITLKNVSLSFCVYSWDKVNGGN